jgi:hypothetical protein
MITNIVDACTWKFIIIGFNGFAAALFIKPAPAKVIAENAAVPNHLRRERELVSSSELMLLILFFAASFIIANNFYKRLKNDAE